MDYGAVFLLLAICVALSLIVCLPVQLILRARRRKRQPADGVGLRREIPRHELPGLAAGLVVLFLGYAQAYLAPETWFGQQMRTIPGQLVFAFGLYAANLLGLIVLALVRRRRA